MLDGYVKLLSCRARFVEHDEWSIWLPAWAELRIDLHRHMAGLVHTTIPNAAGCVPLCASASTQSLMLLCARLSRPCLLRPHPCRGALPAAGVDSALQIDLDFVSHWEVEIPTGLNVWAPVLPGPALLRGDKSLSRALAGQPLWASLVERLALSALSSRWMKPRYTTLSTAADYVAGSKPAEDPARARCLVTKQPITL